MELTFCAELRHKSLGTSCALSSSGPAGSSVLLQGAGHQHLGLLQSFREELEGLIQEQMKKGNNSSNIWALRQIADFMASTSHAVFPASSMSTWVPGCLPGAEGEGCDREGRKKRQKQLGC